MNKLIEARYSPYDFDKSVELDTETAELLLTAATMAPSSFNEQPWRFHYALRQNKEGFKKLYDVILDGNKPWANDVSMLILGVSETKFSKNGKTNKHAFYDLGQSVFAMLMQATELDLFAHQMGGFDAEAAKQAFKLTEGQEPVVMIAIGKRLGTEPKERNRKPLSEIAYDVK